MFRDESPNMQKKRQREAGQAKTRPNSYLRPAQASKRSVNNNHTTSSLPLIYANSPPRTIGSLQSIELGASAEDQAISFFFANYILPDNEYHYGNFQYLSDIYLSQRVGDALTEVVVALGMAGLSNFWKASNIMVSANAKYNSALRLVGLQLNDVNEVKSDQTLVTIMSLSLYEARLLARILMKSTNAF